MKIIYQDNSGKNWNTEAECIAADKNTDDFAKLQQLIASSIGDADFTSNDIARFIIAERDAISAILSPAIIATKVDGTLYAEGVTYVNEPETECCYGCAFRDSPNKHLCDMGCSAGCDSREIIWVKK